MIETFEPAEGSVPFQGPETGTSPLKNQLFRHITTIFQKSEFFC